MMPDMSIVLQDCLEQLENGTLTVEECLALYPDSASELRPLLESAAQLSSLPPVELPPATIDMLEARIFERAVLPARATSVSWPLVIATLVAGMMILGGVWLYVQNDDSNDNAGLLGRIEQQEIMIAELQNQLAQSTEEPPPAASPDIAPLLERIEQQQATIAALQNQLAQRTEEPPTVTPTIETSAPEVSASEEQQDTLPISVSIIGTVHGIDEEAGVLIIDDVVVQMDLTLLPEGFSPQDSPALSVTGDLLDDGIIVASEIEIPAPDAPTTLAEEEATCAAERCHPVLLILSAAYESQYDELEALHQSGFGIGEVARMLAIADSANVTLDSVQAQRASGASWGQIMQSYPNVNPADFAPGQTIGGANARDGAGPQNAPGNNASGGQPPQAPGTNGGGQGNGPPAQPPGNPGGGPPDNPGRGNN